MRDENDGINALRGLIGRAVYELLEEGLAPHRENILVRLQVMGAVSSSASVKALCINARELIIARITH